VTSPSELTRPCRVATLRDVARAAGVSIAIGVRALAGQGVGVGAARAYYGGGDKARLPDQPRRAALASRRSALIGVVLDTLADR